MFARLTQGVGLYARCIRRQRALTEPRGRNGIAAGEW